MARNRWTSAVPHGVPPLPCHCSKDLAKRELAKQKRQARTELHLANWW